MFTIIAWIIVGGLAGWIASKIMGKNAQMGIVANVVSGVLGASVVGFVVGLVSDRDIMASAFNPWSFLAAIVGACIVIFVASKVLGRGKKVKQ